MPNELGRCVLRHVRERQFDTQIEWLGQYFGRELADGDTLIIECEKDVMWVVCVVGATRSFLVMSLTTRGNLVAVRAGAGEATPHAARTVRVLTGGEPCLFSSRVMLDAASAQAVADEFMGSMTLHDVVRWDAFDDVVIAM